MCAPIVLIMWLVSIPLYACNFDDTTDEAEDCNPLVQKFAEEIKKLYKIQCNDIEDNIKIFKDVSSSAIQRRNALLAIKKDFSIDENFQTPFVRDVQNLKVNFLSKHGEHQESIISKCIVKLFNNFEKNNTLEQKLHNLQYLWLKSTYIQDLKDFTVQEILQDLNMFNWLQEYIPEINGVSYNSNEYHQAREDFKHQLIEVLKVAVAHLKLMRIQELNHDPLFKELGQPKSYEILWQEHDKEEYESTKYLSKELLSLTKIKFQPYSFVSNYINFDAIEKRISNEEGFEELLSSYDQEKMYYATTPVRFMLQKYVKEEDLLFVYK